MLELDDELVSFLDKNLFDKVTPNTGQFDDSFLKALFRDDYVTYVGKYITTKSPIVPISKPYAKTADKSVVKTQSLVNTTKPVDPVNIETPVITIQEMVDYDEEYVNYSDYYKASVYSEKGFFGRLAAIYDPILNFESLKSAFGISLWIYFFVMMFGGALLEVKFIPSVNAYISLGKLQMLNLLSICVVNLIIAGILLTIGSYFTKKKKVIEQ
jgi:hypothetical protein